MKYFLDSAKIEEIKEAYHTFGIDGVTTNPRHIMVSGKPFLTVISEDGRIGLRRKESRDTRNSLFRLKSTHTLMMQMRW